MEGEQKDLSGVSSGGGRKKGDDEGGREGSLRSLTLVSNPSPTTVLIIRLNPLVTLVCPNRTTQVHSIHDCECVCVQAQMAKV